MMRGLYVKCTTPMVAEIIKQWDCQKKVSEEFGIAKTTVAYRINNKVILKDHNNKEFVLIRAKDFEKK